MQYLPVRRFRQITNQLSKPCLKYSVEDITRNEQYVDKPSVQKSQVTKLYMMVPNIFTIIISVLCPLTQRNVYQFTCNEQKTPDEGKVHKSFQNCGCKGIDLWLHVTVLAPITGGGPEIFGKIDI